MKEKKNLNLTYEQKRKRFTVIILIIFLLCSGITALTIYKNVSKYSQILGNYPESNNRTIDYIITMNYSTKDYFTLEKKIDINVSIIFVPGNFKEGRNFSLFFSKSQVILKSNNSKEDVYQEYSILRPLIIVFKTNKLKENFYYTILAKSPGELTPQVKIDGFEPNQVIETTSPLMILNNSEENQARTNQRLLFLTWIIIYLTIIQILFQFMDFSKTNTKQS